MLSPGTDAQHWLTGKYVAMCEQHATTRQNIKSVLSAGKDKCA